MFPELDQVDEFPSVSVNDSSENDVMLSPFVKNEIKEEPFNMFKRYCFF